MWSAGEKRKRAGIKKLYKNTNTKCVLAAEHATARTHFVSTYNIAGKFGDVKNTDPHDHNFEFESIFAKFRLTSAIDIKNQGIAHSH